MIDHAEDVNEDADNKDESSPNKRKSITKTASNRYLFLNFFI